MFSSLLLHHIVSPNSDNDDTNNGLGVPAAVGITFVLTLIISIALTLLAVYIVYKMKKKSVTNKNKSVTNKKTISATNVIKNAENSYDDVCVLPVDTQPVQKASDYQNYPVMPIQPNPAYRKYNPEPIYEDTKYY